MKKMLIILCLLPFASFSQTTVIRVKFPVDSLTRHVTYRQETAVAGVKKDKLFNVIYKWFSSNLKPANDTNPIDAGNMAMFGNGTFTGSYIYNGARASSPPESYSIYFTARLTVADEKISIVLTDFKVNLNTFITPLESYYGKPLPGASGNDRYSAATFAMYSYLFDDIDFSAIAFLKDLNKYIAKAKKKGNL